MVCDSEYFQYFHVNASVATSVLRERASLVCANLWYEAPCGRRVIGQKHLWTDCQREDAADALWQHVRCVVCKKGEPAWACAVISALISIECTGKRF